MAKKDLNDYITTMSAIKPSAEIKSRIKGNNGEVTETVASRTYIAKHADKEIAAASQVKGLSERLNRVTEKAAKAMEVKEDDLDDLDAEVEEEEMLDESANVEVSIGNASDGAQSPMSQVPNSPGDNTTTQEMSETAMLIKLVSTLIDKIDEMQNFNPVIHVPAPVIHVTLPETRRTVTKAIERDEHNLIKTVHESIEEVPSGEPLIEVRSQETPKKRRKTTPKDSE